jgi:hypothetical protein
MTERIQNTTEENRTEKHNASAFFINKAAREKQVHEHAWPLLLLPNYGPDRHFIKSKYTVVSDRSHRR